jgi:hypothetical protein
MTKWESLAVGAWLVALVWALLLGLRAKTRGAWREHDDGPNCWCGPELTQICPEWGGEVDACAETCWRCHGEGWVEPYDPERRTLVVHRKVNPETEKA